MTALDWVLLLIIGVSAVLGAMRGLVGVAASVLAWLLAGLAAFQFGGAVAQVLAAPLAPSWGESVSGYVLAFLLVWTVVTLLGWMVRKMVQSAGLSPVDRTMGLGLGAARGVFLACALLLALGLSAVPREPVWRDSLGVAVLMPVAGWMRGGVPDWMAQRMDLEGRGTSLQARLHDQAQALGAALPPGVTPQNLAALRPTALPASVDAPDTPASIPSSAGTAGDAPAAARVP